jgi:hypothetical protein
MPITITNRLKQVLIQLAENQELTPQQRLEADRELDALSALKPGPKPKRDRPKKGLLGE